MVQLAPLSLTVELYTSLQQYDACRMLSVLLSHWQLGGLQYEKHARRGSLL